VVKVTITCDYNFNMFSKQYYYWGDIYPLAFLSYIVGTRFMSLGLPYHLKHFQGRLTSRAASPRQSRFKILLLSSFTHINIELTCYSFFQFKFTFLMPMQCNDFSLLA